MFNTKDKRIARAQLCVTRKQPVGVLPTTFEKGFVSFASFVTDNN